MFKGIVDEGDRLTFYDINNTLSSNSITLNHYEKGILLINEGDIYKIPIGCKLVNTDKIVIDNFNRVIGESDLFYFITIPVGMEDINQIAWCKHHHLKVPTFQKLEGQELYDKSYLIRNKTVFIIPLSKVSKLEGSSLTNYFVSNAKEHVNKLFNTLELGQPIGG